MTISRVSVQRRRADFDKLHALQAQIPNLLEIASIKGSPPDWIALSISIPTVRFRSHPRVTPGVSTVDVSMSGTYPLPPGPTVTFRTPIFNPNVFVAGVWCYGPWSISENLGQFVLRLLRTIALDPEVVNPDSPANLEAADWYTNALRTSPKMFPTVPLPSTSTAPARPTITWSEVT